ncbi:GTP cyclohydrolase 1, partial [Araneus ventricosus]
LSEILSCFEILLGTLCM